MDPRIKVSPESTKITTQPGGTAFSTPVASRGVVKIGDETWPFIRGSSADRTGGLGIGAGGCVKSKHTKAGRRARFRRWASAWWFVTGSDLAVVQAEAIRALGRGRYWQMQNAILQRLW